MTSVVGYVSITVFVGNITEQLQLDTARHSVHVLRIVWSNWSQLA